MNTTPAGDSGFHKPQSLQEFDGCYQNCSDSSDGSASACLSSIIWPDAFDHESMPEAISVLAVREDRLTVQAHQHGKAIKSSEFVDGKHFEFSSGRIELKREFLASWATEPGNVFIGVATGKTVLGLDEKGRGRIEQSGTFAGTGFLIIPIAGTATDVSRIERRNELCSGS